MPSMDTSSTSRSSATRAGVATAERPPGQERRAAGTVRDGWDGGRDRARRHGISLLAAGGGRRRWDRSFQFIALDAKMEGVGQFPLCAVGPSRSPPVPPVPSGSLPSDRCVVEPAPARGRRPATSRGTGGPGRPRALCPARLRRHHRRGHRRCRGGEPPDLLPLLRVEERRGLGRVRCRARPVRGQAEPSPTTSSP